MIAGWIAKKVIDKSVDNKIAAEENKVNSMIANATLNYNRTLTDKNFELEKKMHELEKKLKESFNEKKEIISRTFENTDYEMQLWKKKKILLIGDDDTRIVKRVLRRAGFNIQENLFEDVSQIGTKGFDILFINNYLGNINLKEAVEMVKGLPPNVITFYFTSRHERELNFPTDQLDFDQQDKVNFAKSASQIYGNLLNSLKYQDKL